MRLDRFSHYGCLSLYLSLVGLFFVVNCVSCSAPSSPHFLVLHLHGFTPPPVTLFLSVSLEIVFPFCFIYLKFLACFLPAQLKCCVSSLLRFPDSSVSTSCTRNLVAWKVSFTFLWAKCKCKKLENRTEKKTGKHRVLNNSVLVLFGVAQCFFSFFPLGPFRIFHCYFFIANIYVESHLPAEFPFVKEIRDLDTRHCRNYFWVFMDINKFRQKRNNNRAHVEFIQIVWHSIDLPSIQCHPYVCVWYQIKCCQIFQLEIYSILQQDTCGCRLTHSQLIFENTIRNEFKDF